MIEEDCPETTHELTTSHGNKTYHAFCTETDDLINRTHEKTCSGNSELLSMSLGKFLDTVI